MGMHSGMTMTVHVREETLERLKALKEELRARSYDEVIRNLLKKSIRTRSRFGSQPALSPFEHAPTGHGD